MEVLKGVSVEDPENILKSEAAKLIVNTLSANAYILSVQDDKPLYSRSENLLQKHRGVLCRKGILQTTQYTTLTDALEGVSHEITISGEKYLVDDRDIDSLLGRKVEFYYGEDDNDIVYIAADDRLDVITIDAQDIIEIDGREIIYYTNTEQTKEDSVILPTNLKVIYNHRAKPDYTMDTFDIVSGKIVIASSADGENDIAHITEYRTVFVDLINPDDKIITDKYNAVHNLNLDENELDRLTIYNHTDDEQAVFENIVPGDVLSVAESEDGRLIDIYIVRDTMEGTVESIAETSPRYIIRTLIGKYTVVPKPELINLLKTTAYGKFYFDINGRIAGFDIITDAEPKYAFIITADYFTDDDQEEKVKIKYMDIDGKIKTVLWLAEHVKVDKTKLQDYVELPDVFENGAQLVKMEMQKKWLQIDTTIKAEGEGENTMNMLVDVTSPAAYMAADFNFGGRAIINDKTIVIKIPQKTVVTPTGNKTVVNVDDKTGFIVSDHKSLVNTQKYAFTAYNSDYSSYTPEVILLYENSSLSIGSPILLVSGVETRVNEDDEPIRVVKGYNETGEIEIKDGDKHILAGLGLKPGDIVKYSLDSNSDVTVAGKVFDAKTHDLTPPSPYYPTDYGNSFQVRADNAYKVEGTNIYISDSQLENERLSKLEAVPCKTAAVYKVSKNGKISKINLSQIMTFKGHGKGECVFAQLRYGVGRIVVAYEEG